MTDVDVDVSAPVKHPAKFHRDVMAVIRALVVADAERRFAETPLMLPDYRILDPMAGVGGVHALASSTVQTIGIELEPEWANQHPHTIQGDCLEVMAQWWLGNGRYFDAVVVSPVYGNRMSDHHNAKDSSKRNTYRHTLGRPLSDNSSAGMHFTLNPTDDYKTFHRKAWRLAVDFIRPGGIFILNCKDFYKTAQRGGDPVLMGVTDWHLTTLQAMGLVLEIVETVDTPGNRQGQNGTSRAEYETVAQLRKPV